jgi:hypothetical protein
LNKIWILRFDSFESKTERSPAAAVPATVFPAMRVDAARLAPYHDYPIQFMPDLFGAWTNWAGRWFTPADATNLQFFSARMARDFSGSGLRNRKSGGQRSQKNCCR